MKALINSQGNLEIERNGKLRLQKCKNMTFDVPCGEWCPHFGEPEIYTYEPPRWALEICESRVLRYEKP